MIVWLNGAYLPESKAMIPATDRAFLHGRGVFETLRTYEGTPFRLEDHVARMKASAARFKIPFPNAPFETVVRELCQRNRLRDAAVRLTLSAEGRILVTARARSPLPAAWYEKGAEVMVAPWRRDPRGLVAGHKVTCYFENILVHEEARERGCADALFVGLKGELLEGAVTNVFLVVKGKLITPSAVGILPGVTRKVVLEIAKVTQRKVRLKELWKADEAFLTNALIEVLPIGKPGPVTRQVADAYRELTRTLG